LQYIILIVINGSENVLYNHLIVQFSYDQFGKIVISHVYNLMWWYTTEYIPASKLLVGVENNIDDVEEQKTSFCKVRVV